MDRGKGVWRPNTGRLGQERRPFRCGHTTPFTHAWLAGDHQEVTGTRRHRPGFRHDRIPDHPVYQHPDYPGTGHYRQHRCGSYHSDQPVITAGIAVLGTIEKPHKIS